MAIGLTLNLRLPKGQVESISAQTHDLGLRIISLMLPLKELYGLPADLQIVRPDGHQLELDQTLHFQGLRDGSTLSIQDATVKGAKKTWEEEKIMVTLEDLEPHEADGFPSYQDDPLLFPAEERDVRARYLKEKANDALKDENFGKALQLYAIALSWLLPEDSDRELAAAIFGNRALVHLKLRDWLSARNDAAQSLVLQPENMKVRYRLAVAERELGHLENAQLEFRAILKRDPKDRTTRTALAAVEAELQARKTKEVEQPTPEVPPAIKWRIEQLQRGYSLPRFVNVFQRIDGAGSVGSIASTCAAALRHVLREQAPVERFYRDSLISLSDATKEAKTSILVAILLGVGGCSAVSASASLVNQGKLRSATVVEPCRLLVDHCRQLDACVRVLQSQGQIDNEFAIPSTAFGLMAPSSAGGQEQGLEADAEGLGPPSQAPTVALICERLSDDLIGEKLLATFAAGIDAAQRHLPPKTKIACVPARAHLCCAPMELRCDEAAGWDVSKINALRFSAHETPEERVAPGARGWKCQHCSWLNSPQTKYECEMCKQEKSAPGLVNAGSRQRESSGWWPVDLDQEGDQAGFCCRTCASEQVVWTYDFDDATAFSQQRRQLTRPLEMRATCRARMNAMAVWWELEGPGGATLSSRPHWHPEYQRTWPGKRQALYYLGFEIGVEQGEKLTFNVSIKDGLSRVKFELVAPKLTERMGLVKFEVKLTNMQAVEELRKKLDLSTNRLTAPVHGTCLTRRDKLIQFGPFELAPGTVSKQIWDRVEERIKLHVNRPLKGDAPITCVFRHGAYEGTVRWPVPGLADGAAVPRLPLYFESLRQCRYKPYTSAMAAALEHLGPGKLVLELGCGPVPLLAMDSTRHGARAWAVEMVPELQELAQEAIRENGLEMIFKYKGYANYSFFGEPKKPEDPSVRVMKAMPSTSLRPGATPKFLDGGRAHLVACRPDDGLLGEDYLETMWHAAEQLLVPGGTMVPNALCIHAAPVQWLPLGRLEIAGFLHSHLYAGHTVQASPSDHLGILSRSSTAVLRIDLLHRSWPLPAAEGSLKVDCGGVLTGVAFWHEPDFSADGGQPQGASELHPCAMVCFLQQPCKVSGGEHVRFSLNFVNRQLQLSIIAGTPE